MTRAPKPPATCDTCGAPIRFARDAINPTRWRVLEAADREPWSTDAAGSMVLTSGHAWRPHDLVEHWMVRHELTESAARELVSGFPWHRLHAHPTHEEENNPS